MHFSGRADHEIWCLIGLLLAACCFWQGLPALSSLWRDKAEATAPVTAPQRELVRVQIKDLHPGRRVLAGNPELGETLADSDIDPAKWRLITLAMTKPDGGRLDIELLRSMEWIENSEAVGKTVELDLVELGADGPADVMAIDACPPIESDDGQGRRVITGTFAHNRIAATTSTPPSPTVGVNNAKVDVAKPAKKASLRMTAMPNVKKGEPWPGYWIKYPADEVLSHGLSIEVTNGVITGVAREEGDTTEYDILATRYSPGDIDATDVTRTLWRHSNLTLTKPDGSEAKLSVGRPLWWYKASEAKVDGEVDLAMHEVGIEGISKVLSITPLDADSRENDQGMNLVIGKIEHHNAEVWELFFNNGMTKPLGVTANHPIMSADRNEWVPAGELRINEKVKTADGTVTLTAKSAHPTRETVYNLEVHRSHSYHVSQFAILAHNTGIGCDIRWSSPAVNRAAQQIRSGATEIRVASRSQAEELFLRLFQGDGFRNTTGWAREEVKRFGKAKTYHWDDVFQGPSQNYPGKQLLQRHYDDGKLHNYMMHLQIHTPTDVIRILFD